MQIFLDTEFTDLKNPQLISIGLAGAGDNHFYAELNDFEVAGCSDFVKANVLPQLGALPGLVMDTQELHHRMSEWLAQFSCPGPIICYDFDGDWVLFQRVMRGDISPWISNENVRRYINSLLVRQYFLDTGLAEHHALHDALANRFAYRKRVNPDACFS